VLRKEQAQAVGRRCRAPRRRR